MIKLEHGKTYIDQLGFRVKVKEVNGTILKGSNGKMYWAVDGVGIGNFAYNLVKETDGSIKHFFKNIFNYFKAFNKWQ